jgi:hypothetical protein
MQHLHPFPVCPLDSTISNGAEPISDRKTESSVIGEEVGAVVAAVEGVVEYTVGEGVGQMFHSCVSGERTGGTDIHLNANSS